jgi:hypothetical protein
MRSRLYVLLGTLASIVFAAAPLPAQDSQQKGDQRVVEDFVTTRGAGFGERPKNTKTSSGSPSSNSGQPKSTSRPNSNVASKGKTKSSTSKGKSKKSNDVATTAAGAQVNGAAKDIKATGNATPNDGSTDASDNAGAIGLGYTILLSSNSGANTVVDASKEFVAGDKIRIALETNADGFLYIFNAENDREPTMLFPHAALDGGSNQIAAHARDFFPADLRYSFEFDDKAATEHLYVIFSRRPLADVPAGDGLVKFCGSQAVDSCYWKPANDQWARIMAGAAGRVIESKNKDLAQVQPAIPVGARGIKMKKDEPAPAVVRMNASADRDVLLTRIELVHK